MTRRWETTSTYPSNDKDDDVDLHRNDVSPSIRVSTYPRRCIDPNGFKGRRSNLATRGSPVIILALSSDLPTYLGPGLSSRQQPSIPILLPLRNFMIEVRVLRIHRLRREGNSTRCFDISRKICFILSELDLLGGVSSSRMPCGISSVPFVDDSVPTPRSPPKKGIEG